MEESKLSISEREAGEVTILMLAGQMVLDDGDLVFDRYVSGLVDRGRTKLLVDLGQVTFIDSSSVGTMAAKLKLLRQHGGDLRLVNLPGRLQRLFAMLKLMNLFRMFDDEQTALRSFEEKPGGSAP